MGSGSSSLQVVILAAGKGVRMRSELPKVLHKLCGQSLVERALRAVSELNPGRIVVVVGFGAELLRAEVARLITAGVNKGAEVLCVDQLEQHGTGHATQLAYKQLLPNLEEVLILPGDAPLVNSAMLKDFLDYFRTQQATLSLLSCSPPDAAAFGRVVRGKNGDVEAVVERKDCTTEQAKISEINSSIYLAKYGFLTEALPSLKNDNAQKEYYLTDIVGFGAKQGAKVTAYCSPRWQNLVGANNRAELSELEKIRRREISLAWMEAGVTLEDPDSTYIDELVEIGSDTFIGAGTRLRGQVKIASSCAIDGDVWITNSSIGSRCHIKPGCVIEDSELGESCDVGPYAHLRPGSKLSDKVKIGNFVETKKTTLGKGSKANHLSYVGDAVVGADVNIGAGTITCNYDGKNKHQTTIADNVFVGSNSCLVAPVTIGLGAYIGAGSTVTKDVPAGALGIGRSRQTNLEGWSERKKDKSK